MNFLLTFPKKRGKYLIFSLPQTNHYQVIKNQSFQPSTFEITKEKKWGNKIAVFILNDVNEPVKILFHLTPLSINKTIPCQFFLKDCQKNLLLNSKNYLVSNRFIDGTNPKIVNLSKKIVGGERNLYQIVYKLYYFVLDYLTYGKPIEGLYSYQQAMEEKVTDCGGFSTFLASLLQSLNIPTRLVAGFLIKNDLLSQILTFNFSLLTFNFLLMHTWLEIALPDGSWFPVDPSIEWRRNHGLTKRDGGLGFIPGDRLVISFGQYHQLTIDDQQYKIDLLQNPVYL